jgi:AcrR family transcriptional regulator
MRPTAEEAPDPQPGLVARRQPVQARSQQGYERLLSVARKLAHEKDFDAISIRDLAAEARCSIGSFYYRFGTKDEFFDVLVDDMIDRRRIEVRQIWETHALADLPCALARGALATHRAYAGLLRSMIKKQLEGQHRWEKVSQLGQEISAEFCQRVAAAKATPLTPEQQQRIKFAFVWLYAMLAQSIMGLDVMFSLDSDFFEHEAIDAFDTTIKRVLGWD